MVASNAESRVYLINNWIKPKIIQLFSSKHAAIRHRIVSLVVPGIILNCQHVAGFTSIMLFVIDFPLTSYIYNESLIK